MQKGQGMEFGLEEDEENSESTLFVTTISLI